MNKSDKIYIAGHTGMVGSAIRRKLLAEGYDNLIGYSSPELDLTDQQAVAYFFAREKPDYVFLAAAKVGGIHANSSQPAAFIYENLMIQNNIIHNAYVHGVKKLLFLGSSCIYPRMAPQPIAEDALLTGALEETNKSYALAKISGIVMCQSYRKQYGCNYISAMPTNLYGPNDNYHPTDSHVIPALIRKIHEAKFAGSASVEIWGTGQPVREFLYVDDLAEACFFLMKIYDAPEVVNIGTGVGITIRELALAICKIIGFSGNLMFNTDMPDGTPVKILSVNRINNLGWSATTKLEEGLRITYNDFQQHTCLK
jgi:GDP-L-fucose synthase